MKGYKIGERVKSDIRDIEGVIIATDDREDKYRKVKVKYDSFFEGTRWEFESMVCRIITN
jgi:hypothetical protein